MTLSNSDENIVKKENNKSSDISLKSFKNNNEQSTSYYSEESEIIDSSSLSSSNNDEIVLENHNPIFSVPHHPINLCDRNNIDDIKICDGLKISNLAIQKSNDVTIGTKNLISYNGPVTINNIVSTSDIVNQNSNENNNNTCDICHDNVCEHNRNQNCGNNKRGSEYL